MRRKNGTTVVVRCRTPKVSLGHSSRLSPRVNCAEAGATCGIAGPLRFFVFSEKLTESRRNKPSFWSRESQNDARRASTGRAVALTESAYRSVKQNQLDQSGEVWTAQIYIYDRLDGCRSAPRRFEVFEIETANRRFSRRARPSDTPAAWARSECTSRWRWRITSGLLARHRRARR